MAEQPQGKTNIQALAGQIRQTGTTIFESRNLPTRWRVAFLARYLCYDSGGNGPDDAVGHAGWRAALSDEMARWLLKNAPGPDSTLLNIEGHLT